MVQDGTVSIPLSQGKVAVIDAEDADGIMRFKWSTNKFGWTWYAYREENGKRVYLHRYLMGLTHGMKIVVDHIDGDGLNCRRSNLRLATRAENCRSTHRPLKHKYKGVRLRCRNSWQAYVMVNGKYITVGSYSSAEDAARAHDEAARKFHGEFARLNFK